MVNIPEEQRVSSEPEQTGTLLLHRNDQLLHSLCSDLSVELQDLEQLAKMATIFSFLKQYSVDPVDPHVRQKSINKLRQLFNMEFKMRCDKCDKAHYQDEISAPER